MKNICGWEEVKNGLLGDARNPQKPWLIKLTFSLFGCLLSLPFFFSSAKFPWSCLSGLFLYPFTFSFLWKALLIVSFYTFFFPSFLFPIYVSSQPSPPTIIVTPFSQEKFKETNLSFPFAKTKHKHKVFLLLKHFTEIRLKLHFYVQL